MAFNNRGEVRLSAEVTARVPTEVVVVDVVTWSAFSPRKATVNALASQRLTHRGRSSAVYDQRVEVR